MNINIALQPVISIIAGVVILAVPKVLNIVIAVYLIIIGVLGLIR